MANIYSMVILFVVFTVMINNCMAKRSPDTNEKDVLLTKLRSVFLERTEKKANTCDLDPSQYLSTDDIASLPSDFRASVIKDILDSAKDIRTEINSEADVNLSNDRELVDFIYQGLQDDKDDLSTDDYNSKYSSTL